MRIGILAICIWASVGCDSDIQEINKLFENHSLDIEEATNIEMLYSDSAKVRVRLKGPKLIRHVDSKNPIDEFPEGIAVEFFDNNNKVRSWLTADYAIRYEKEGAITVRKNVVLRNQKNEKIESGELIWNERNGSLSSDQFVRVTLPTNQDTIYGYGIEVDQDFTVFEVKRKFSGNFKMDQLTEVLKK